MAQVTRVPFRFLNRAGAALDGLLELPVGRPRAYALFAHCFTCTKAIGAATRISRALAARGFAVLRFDFTGLGNSEGDFANTNFSSNIDDLLAAVAALRETQRAPELLIGHSLGGAAVLVAARQLAEVQAVVTIAAPSDPAHVSHLFKAHAGIIEREGQAVVEVAGREFTIRKQFLADLHSHRLLDGLHDLNKALLVLHSPADRVVGIEHARRIYDAARHPKSFISLDKADHLLSRGDDADYVAETIAAWAGRYVGRPFDQGVVN